MDRLWSPWRYRYITKASPDDECVFCAKARDGDDKANLVIHRGQTNFLILNLFPYTNGHLMVAPYEHIANLDDLPEETSAEMMQLTRLAVKALREVYWPQGLNIGMNLGACAGAGIAGHAHMHVLPRWPGDANFMTTIGETRVLPEDLSITRDRLTAAIKSLM